MGPQMDPKITQKSDFGLPGPPRDAKGRPEASRELFWGLLGTILEQSWAFLGTPWDHFRLFRLTPTPSLFVALVTCFYRSLRPMLPRIPGSAGARASAYN